MPTESELRKLLQGPSSEEPRLDADDIIRRARARRRPKRMAVGALGGLAAVALVVPVALGLGSMPPGSMSASDEAGSLAAKPQSAEQDSRLLQEDLPASCQAPLWEGEAAAAGVALEVTQDALGSSIILTLVNGTADPVTGTLASAPAVLIARDGVIVGDAPSALEPSAVDLAPGGQLSLVMPMDAVDCSGGPLEAGSYEASAVLAIRREDGGVVIVESGFTPLTIAAAQ